MPDNFVRIYHPFRVGDAGAWITNHTVAGASILVAAFPLTRVMPAWVKRFVALGSLLVHATRAGEVRRRVAILQALVSPVSSATFVGFFAIANAFFPIIHVSLENPRMAEAGRRAAVPAT